MPHPEANLYALLLVALLERGGAMTLEAVAARLSEAGKGPPEAVLRSLKRCRPDRPPVYRHGDLYHLDPFDWDLSLWAFRLGLRPPQAWPDRDRATPETPEAAAWRIEARHDAAAAERAALRRVVLRAFPAEAPAALVLLDVDSGAMARYAGESLDAAKAPERWATSA